ncbi:MAG: proteasome assembly chaperone family protein [Thaumarchaeota archaeon]|nr:proteasome assembly chaperone family protein [Nitrososphaerota archaeon]
MANDGVITATDIFTPEPKNPVVICGLPGSGYVGKVAVEHLVSVFKAKRFREYNSSSFPPQANIGDDGTVHRLKGEFYYAKTGQGNDLLIFTADAQPTTSRGEYELSETVVKDGKALGAIMVISLAAYITGSFSEERRVFGTSTSLELTKRLTDNGVEQMKEGTITGMNGLVVGMAELNSIDGFCLLGETSGYVVDPSASQKVLEALSRILDVKIDLTKLSERVVEANELIGQIQRMAAESEEGVVEAGGATGQTDPKRQPGYIG